nr:MAG TPA: putative cytoplasmic protein [Caudoviricetes sp.]
MGKLISLAEYAAMHNKAAISVQQKARRGGFRTARKIGRNWVIDAEEPYSDNRHGDRANVIRARVCRQCGREFQGGPRAWYCPECRTARKEETDSRYLRGKAQRPLGTIDHCKICGKEYVVKSARQKYCPDCAEKAVKEVDRKQAIEHYEATKKLTNPIRNEKRRVGMKTCVICGKEFPADGTARNTCSDECRKKQRQEWQREADKKRRNK